MKYVYVIVWQKKIEAGSYNPIFLSHYEAELFSGNTRLILQTNYILNTEHLPITKHKLLDMPLGGY
jgi:hypothetical protein